MITFRKDKCALLCAVCDSPIKLTGGRGVDGDTVLGFNELDDIVSIEDVGRVGTAL
jgi:hypothetical protein